MNESSKKKKSNKRSQCSSKNSNNSNNEESSSENSSSSNQSNNNNDSKLCCFSALDYIILASTLSIALSEELSNTDIGILSTFFAVLSDELALISSMQNCNSNNDQPVFVPPVPDVAVTSSKNNTNKKYKKKK